MTRQHSIVPHKTNYFFIPLEDDYLLAYEMLADSQPDTKHGPADCKAMLTSVLENWMNSKRPTAKCADDLNVYFTMDEWVDELRGRYKRSTIMQCIKEMETDGSYTDAEGKYGDKNAVYTGTVIKHHFVQNTYQYRLNLPVVIELVAALPEQSPYGKRNRPSLGRPLKSGTKLNRLNLNGLKTYGIIESRLKTDDNTPEYRLKKDGSTYITQTSNYTDLNKTQESVPPAQTIPTTFASSDASPSLELISQVVAQKQETILPQEQPVPPPTTQTALLVTPLTEPDMTGAWVADKCVQYAEYHNKKRYTDIMRPQQLQAAAAIHAKHKTLTLLQFKQAYDERNDAWWQEHKKGKLHVSDMRSKGNSGVDRVSEMLERMEGQNGRKVIPMLATSKQAVDYRNIMPPRMPSREQRKREIV